ncbi:glycosyl hydrolase 108 family protein [Chryseobacterium sp. KCF3-3]|uniref:glycosyl hydrolase 108 family protein n=1 Tax=Chryseobacterium sp. KCF3-3 TaxID=3231511 RepID=UPI0038B283E5
MTGNIAGDQNPQVGKTYSYEIQPSGLSFGLRGEYEWYIYKQQKNGLWKDITDKPKTGEKVTYKFGEIALGIEFQMKVYETKKGILPGLADTRELAGTLTIIPASNKVPKIDKVILFNRGSKDINKASYRDTLIVQAHCIAMFNKEIEFHLWEDDAPGKGHDPDINKNNQHTRSYKARVNANGIAEVQIPLMPDEKILRQTANRFMMKGDRDEGVKHEYYITATYSEKIQEASQVNVEVTNPDYKGKPQNSPKPKRQPEKNTPKFPTGQGAGPKQLDPKGNIIEAVFIDDTGKELSKVAVGDKVRVRIHSKNMVGKHIQYVIWESDSVFHDEVYRSRMIKIPADVYDTSGFIITKDIFEKGIDSSIGDLDSYKQNYFIEIISRDLSAESEKFGVNSDGLIEVEKVKSAAAVQKQPKAHKGCGDKYCIDKNSPPSELIREINIRLAGFGGNVPTDKFTDRTEKMLKQFQRDYMKVTETGKVCGNVLRAIDEFSKNFEISTILWNQLKCSCSTKGKMSTSKLRHIKEVNSCSGFGDGTGKNTYKGNIKDEAYNMYEYPGIHRSLLFAFKALQFYFSKQNTYKIDSFSSGYRCRFKDYVTTNHQGKAIDIQFSKGNWEIRGPQKKNLVELRNMRDTIFIKYLGAQKEWPNPNVFSIEPIDLLYDGKGNPRYDHTFSWIHMDVREFDSIYLENKYFCENSTNLNGKSIIQLAIESGYTNTCNCFDSYQTQQNQPAKSLNDTNCEDRFSKVAPIILRHEGGYVNHTADKGGPTNKGITLTTWKQYAKEDLDIDNPTLEKLKKITNQQATIIYRKRYWEPKKFCEINDERVSLMIYDWTITSGGAAEQVQKLLVNEFGKDIEIDGGIGSQTIKAINNVENQDKLLNRLAEIRKQYYTNLTYTDGKKNDQDVFLEGWNNRVDDCLKFKP